VSREPATKDGRKRPRKMEPFGPESQASTMISANLQYRHDPPSSQAWATIPAEVPQFAPAFSRDTSR